MGLDLSLYPIDGLSGRFGFSHTVINVPRGEAVAEIAEVAASKIPEMFDISGYSGGTVKGGQSDGETMYGRFVETPYGEPYTWVEAHVLLPILNRHLPEHPTTKYIAALPKNTLVILGWH